MNIKFDNQGKSLGAPS